MPDDLMKRLREPYPFELPEPRPLLVPLEDYYTAPSGSGSQALNWSDKKYRLVYDLVAAIRDLRAETAAALDAKDAEIAGLREDLATNHEAAHVNLNEVLRLRVRLAAAEKALRLIIERGPPAEYERIARDALVQETPSDG